MSRKNKNIVVRIVRETMARAYDKWCIEHGHPPVFNLPPKKK